MSLDTFIIFNKSAYAKYKDIIRLIVTAVITI